jgi:hypothetical protein
MHHFAHGSGLIIVILVVLFVLAVRGGSNSGDSK